ncbi:MAG: exodeoxyribonuclease III [Candidatus Riflebacteria bacterium HGW-Riflebacteria-1]|jgi:exodeoxyribonuclease-3|nr:MAG: exodeoxyribonuclease III [Candidatus Riflebacteria bacterium HGW-Riflebacteria-1]
MKIVTFNVNGIRARLHQLQCLVETHHPDIIALQEIKCVNDAFPFDAVREMGYQAEVFGQKGHYGVALLSKQKAVDVQFNFSGSDPQAQRRLIVGTYVDEQKRPFVIMNGYFPQGESRDHPDKFPAKQKFYADLTAYLNSDFKTSDNVLIVGDMNVAPDDLDVGIGEQNAKRWLKAGKCAFLPEEREWLQQLVGWGLHDLYRELHPGSNERFSWFDYRSGGFEDYPKRGLRIDLVLGTSALRKRCISAAIDYEIRAMEKPSDHTPVIVEFS